MSGDGTGWQEERPLVGTTDPRERSRGVLRLRLLLGVFWAAVVVVMLASQVLDGWGGPEERTLDDLYTATARDRTDAVFLTGGLEPGVEGEATQQAWWDEDGRSFTATWTVVADVGGVESEYLGPESEGPEVTSDDVALELRRLAPDLVVEQTLVDPGPGATVLGVRVAEGAGMVAALFFVAWFATLVLLVNGPQPWRATRWAWFWLSAPPLGLLAFVALSGPTPGLGSTRPVGRRLTGGWAFLLGLVLAGVMGEHWWW